MAKKKHSENTARRIAMPTRMANRKDYMYLVMP